MRQMRYQIYDRGQQDADVEYSHVEGVFPNGKYRLHPFPSAAKRVRCPRIHTMFEYCAWLAVCDTIAAGSEP